MGDRASEFDPAYRNFVGYLDARFGERVNFSIVASEQMSIPMIEASLPADDAVDISLWMADVFHMFAGDLDIELATEKEMLRAVDLLVSTGVVSYTTPIGTVTKTDGRIDRAPVFGARREVWNAWEGGADRVELAERFGLRLDELDPGFGLSSTHLMHWS